MSKRQEFCLALHHLALTFFVICALPLWYLTGILSDVPPDVSADALHAGRRQLVILFGIYRYFSYRYDCIPIGAAAAQ